jgi:pseudouridine synthase
MERLQKVLAAAGIASRRECEGIIIAGRVKVNGEKVEKLGVKVSPKDKVEVDGRIVQQSEPKVYLILNKPAGYVTTVKDPEGRKKVLDLIKNMPYRIYPIGRLDFATEGLLLLTNDGDFAQFLTKPSNKIMKTYLALVKGVPGKEALKLLREGVALQDGITAPAKAKIVQIIGGNAVIEISIYEGKNRQIRRMMEAIGNPVLSLIRTKIGKLELGNLKKGDYRFLTAEEIKIIKSMPTFSKKEAKSISKK